MLSLNANAGTAITTGYDWSEGNYGSSSSTKIHYIPLTIKYQDSNWNMKFTLPWLKITGAAVTVDSSGNVISTSGATNSVSGMGDILTSATYHFSAMGQGKNHIVDGTVKIKLPTADSAKGLGTGETDLSLQFDYAYNSKMMMPFATAGYKRFGQSSSYSLDSVWYSTLGLQFNGDKRSSGILWDYQQATSSTTTDKSEWMVYLTSKINRRWSSTLYYVTGTTDSSIDNEAGFTLSVKM
jgi:uncharacterized protein YaiE (UPF0345 family)